MSIRCHWSTCKPAPKALNVQALYIYVFIFIPTPQVKFCVGHLSSYWSPAIWSLYSGTPSTSFSCHFVASKNLPCKLVETLLVTSIFSNVIPKKSWARFRCRTCEFYIVLCYFHCCVVSQCHQEFFHKCVRCIAFLLWSLCSLSKFTCVLACELSFHKCQWVNYLTKARAALPPLQCSQRTING